MAVSLKKLTEAFGEEAALVLLPVLRREYTEDELMDRFPAADRRYRECYHPPGYDDMAMHVANEILDMHGIEGQSSPDGRTGVSYCNAGDPYVVTLILTKDNNFRVGCTDNLRP